jgi:hypothetical protein
MLLTMPTKEHKLGVSSHERPKQEAADEGAPFASLAEAKAYQEWKAGVPAVVRRLVESAMRGREFALEPTGLPRVDAFLERLGEALSGAHPSGASEQEQERREGFEKGETDDFIDAIRTLETDQGTADGIALLAGPDVPFTTKRDIWEGHVAPMVHWLREQDLAPLDLEELETSEREEEESTEGERSETSEDAPPPEPDAFHPSMDELAEGEMEPRAQFTVTPFYGGYYRGRAWPEWDVKTLQWKKGKEVVATEVRDVALDELAVRALRGTVRGGQELTLPVPYGWEVDTSSLQVTPQADAVITQDTHGRFVLKVEGEGVWQYAVRTGKPVRPRPLRPDALPGKVETAADTRLPKELDMFVRETAASDLSVVGKARAIIRHVRDGLEYSNDSSMNAVYCADPAVYAERVWEHKKADCDVANSVAAFALRQAGIACRMIDGHYVKAKALNGSAAMHGGTRHAWLEVYDEERNEWFRADATPKGDPTLDDMRPDEESRENDKGDYGEQEAEIMSDEALEELIRLLEAGEGANKKERKTGEERELDKFTEQAACTTEEAREVLGAFKRVRELKDAKGERIGAKLVKAWNDVVHIRLKRSRVYEGPVRRSEGDELDDPVMKRLEQRAGERDPSGYLKAAEIEKREKLFGGLDVYMLLDLSGSMKETDPVSGREKRHMQRDFAMLYADSLMQCAQISRKAEGRLRAPLPLRLEVVSIHGGASTDMPLVDRWGPKEQVALYRAVNQAAGGGTPDHLGLLQIETDIKRARAAWEAAPHKLHELPPAPFVVASLDGGSDDRHETHNVVNRLRHHGAAVYGYGMTAAAKPVEAIYAPHGFTLECLEDQAETVARDTIKAFRSLHPERVKRGRG